MKKLVIDIKDGYAAIAANDESGLSYYKIEFEESDFVGESGDSKSLTSLGLFGLADENLRALHDQAEYTTLVVPMRFSMVKPLTIDKIGYDNLGGDFLAWEATQQLPDDLGDFETGFYKLRESYDSKSYKFMFYASTKDFIDVLAQFVASNSDKNLEIKSEAIGLFNAVNLASEGKGLAAAIAVEHDGASVVIAHDGDFVSGKFIPGDSPALGEEIMYYVIANSSGDIRPRVLLCGDLDHMDHLGKLDWADRLQMPAEFGLQAATGIDDPMMYVAAAGVNFLSDD